MQVPVGVALNFSLIQ